MTMIMRAPRYLVTIAAVAMVAMTMAAQAETPLTANEMAHWQAAYAELQGMSPKWGVQSPEAFKASVDAGVPVFFLDVRTPTEWAGGIVEGATTVTLTELPTEDGVAALPDDPNAIIGVYCKSGHRSTLALTLLHHLGYSNAVSMAGGFEAWDGAGYPVVEIQ